MILICGATENEVASVRFDEIFKEVRFGSGYYQVGAIGTKALIKAVLGVGKINAAVGLMQVLFDYQPESVLFVGLAGSFQGKSGYFTPNTIVEYDYDLTPLGRPRGSVEIFPQVVFDLDPSFCKRHNIQFDYFATGDRFLTNQNDSDVHQFLEEHEINIIDMESYAIQKVLNRYSIPSLIVRFVSDSTQSDNNSASYNAAVNTDPFKNIVEDFISLNSDTME